MKKAFILAPAIVLALTASAFAQGGVSKGKDRPETVNIQISGTWDTHFIFRSRELSQWASGSALSTDGSTTYLAPDIWIRLDIEMTDKISAVIELGMHNVPDGQGGIGDDDFNPEFREVYAMVSELFTEGLSLKIGQVWHDFDVRGRHGSIVFDSFYSEPFLGDGALTILGVTLPGQSPDGRSTPEYGHSAGFLLTFRRDAITFDTFMFPKVSDSAGGYDEAKNDESIYGLDFFYALDSLSKGSRIGAIFLANNYPGSGTTFTLGIAGDLFFLADNALEVFAEVYFQFGDSGDDEIDASGIALQVGARYNFVSSEMKPWIELKITWLSGDDDPDDDNENWQSKEHQTDLMILESEVYGVDWDTNYFCVKVQGGLGFMPEGGQNKLNLWMIIGFAQANEEVGFVTGDEDSLGIEVDVKVSYAFSKACWLDAGIGANFGNDVMENSILENDDSSFLFWMGANARW